ncbi:hypothetical protein ACER0C_001737 [Sarotherodon galilaeus]
MTEVGSVILESPPFPVMEGETISLHCKKKGALLNHIADFYKDDLKIGTGYSGKMVLHNVSKSDEGLYKCIISGAGESPETSLVVINSSLENQNEEVVSVILEGPAHVLEGEAVTLHCRNKTLSASLPAVFYKDGIFIGTSSTGNMTIHQVYKSHEGLYKCRISGGGESPGSWLSVRVGSVILESPPFPVMEGETVILRCKKKGALLNHIADFYKDDLKIGTGYSGKMIIHNVSRSDEGLYKCIISGAGESPESLLTVKEQKAEVVALILETPAHPVMEGESVTLHCKTKMVSASLAAVFYKDDIFIGTNSMGNMTISTVYKSHEGFYKCRISGVGESSESWLSVQGLHRDASLFSDTFLDLLLLLRVVFTIVMVALLLLLVGLLHCGKLSSRLEIALIDTKSAI